MPLPLHDSSYFPALQQHCLSFPGVTEDHPWGDTAYKVHGKMFACVDKHPPLRVTVKADPSDADALVQHPLVAKASYVGRFGWVTITIEERAALELALGLIEMSYQLVARKR